MFSKFAGLGGGAGLLTGIADPAFVLCVRVVILADIDPMFAFKVVICDVRYVICPFRAWFSDMTTCIIFRRAAKSAAMVLNSKSALGGGL